MTDPMDVGIIEISLSLELEILHIAERIHNLLVLVSLHSEFLQVFPKR